jgi:hypothetical protein
VNGGHEEQPEDFSIPPPPTLDAEASDIRSLIRAAKEEEGNESGNLERVARRGDLDWNLRFVLKILLFVFVVFLNVWWDTRVADWVWYSGYIGGKFHLSDAVLIALVSTSTANFLALILIVARHLFPFSK